jgi:proteasome lid subunit RPN8/RPN11
MDLIIIERHFSLIVSHCRENYPAEAGGFLGGIGNLILGVFPVPNFAFIEFREKHEFGIAEADCLRANQFFEEYKMDVLGFYHSHPSSQLPVPSKQDITAQTVRALRLMMVISLADLQSTKVATFFMSGTTPVKQILAVIKDEAINKYLLELDIERQKQNYLQEMKKLDARVEQILKKAS